jgi:hypothetical protein
MPINQIRNRNDLILHRRLRFVFRDMEVLFWSSSIPVFIQCSVAPVAVTSWRL